MAIKRLQDGRWTVYYKDRDGRKKWEYFRRGSKGKKDAQARDFEIKSKRKRGEDVTSGQPQHSLPDLCQAYLDHLSKRNYNFFEKSIVKVPYLYTKWRKLRKHMQRVK